MIITKEQVKEWLGEPAEYEAIDVIFEIVNGRYTPKQLAEDIKESTQH